ncbi:MAG: hypothetical protein CM1200mP20_16210 [Pseudomonadota bacterium]|nr:MAG: hypothetical protein CM1200mP20_16210 [Pseudomonadota bacterium]
MGGEPGLDDPAFRRRLEGVWGMQAMNANYGVSDVLCNFAGQCTHQNDLHFLLSTSFCLNWSTLRAQTSALGRRTGRRTGADEPVQRLSALLRFRTGDLVA